MRLALLPVLSIFLSCSVSLAVIAPTVITDPCVQLCVCFLLVLALCKFLSCESVVFLWPFSALLSAESGICLVAISLVIVGCCVQ